MANIIKYWDKTLAGMTLLLGLARYLNPAYAFKSWDDLLKIGYG
jgi:hypothetical protein